MVATHPLSEISLNFYHCNLLSFSQQIIQNFEFQIQNSAIFKAQNISQNPIFNLEFWIWNSFWAVEENWTLDLFLTKEVLYPWATTAYLIQNFIPMDRDEILNLKSTERETRLELATYSLEGYRSTNWATPALSTVALAEVDWCQPSLKLWLASGGNRIRTCEDISQQIYSLSQLAALVFPQLVFFEHEWGVTLYLPNHSPARLTPVGLGWTTLSNPTFNIS